MTLALPTDVKETVALKNERRIFGPPGTGKTTHLANKIKGYIESRAYRPSEIIVTSFTRAAASEVASRGTGIPQENIQTLHALGYRALGGGEIAETHIVEWNKWVSEKTKMLRFQLSTGGGRDAEDKQDDDRAPRGAPGDGIFAEYMIRRAKFQPLRDKTLPFLERFVTLWTEWKRETGYIDFQDMIDLPFERQLPPPHGAKVLICDEFQDFTKAEARLARFWGAQMVELILAGDDDQCLYSFKGASAENLLYPELPAGQVTVLERSYRVPRAVQAYAERWIGKIPKVNRYPKKYEARNFEGNIRYEPLGAESTRDVEFDSVEAEINKHRAEARYEDKKNEREEKGNDVDKAERVAWRARAERMALPEGDTEDAKKALADAEKALTNAEKALTNAEKALARAIDEEEKARIESVVATEAAAVKIVDLVADAEATPDNAVILDYARVGRRLSTISLHSGRKDPVKRSWEDPEVYLKNALVQYAARGKSIMFLASCAYMLEPLKAMLRVSGIPFHNPYRRKRTDWNPLQPSNNGISSNDRLLAFLRPSVSVWGNEARMWTIEDFMQWTDVLQKTGVLRHHGKTPAAIKRYYDELVDTDPAALNQSLDVVEHLSDWLTDEALQNALDQNLEWFEGKLLAAKDAMKFPIHVAKALGGAALMQEPNIIIGTIHSVKGGTVDVVYLFPDISMNAVKETKTQEGRDALVRMFYVGMTRAKETLILCAPADGERCAKFPRI